MNIRNYALHLLLVVVTLVGCSKQEGSTVSSPSIPSSTASRPQTRDEMREAASAAANGVKEATKNQKVHIDLAPLLQVRSKVSDFYATHLGLPKQGAVLPRFVDVSFDAVMASMWNDKVLRKNVSDSTLGKTSYVLDRYMQSDRKKSTLSEFIFVTDSVVKDAKKSIDWQKLCARYAKNKKHPVDARRCELAKQIVRNLTGKDFIAYGMTELLPGDARLNVPYLDMLLRNAGVSYLMHTPAKHDDMLSLGFYQFTSFALRKDEEATEGASIVNGFVRDGGVKIPDSVVYLEGDQHHVAAVYFAVHNILRMTGFLSDKGVTTLLAKHNSFQDEMVMFVAAAHHSPGHAYKATARWVNTGMRGGMTRAYPKNIRFYADKTHVNLVALYEFGKRKM